ncbi:DUF2802 domain-containing protein [Planctobacterium marinum]|uniref:DUF2802 domain-containing protein n=1 Tax=Planctobacterium marinum TaxID=1631968 RepID=UPI001E6017B0|nr:DUF2802 domain-containing protein [Planctobacterium marinum]MCC2606180.1 DUF2802 domain-containing protein [Planctobacterium marinum]
MEFWVANKAIVIAIGALLFNVVVWGIFALKQRTENARIAALESEIRNLKQKQKQQEEFLNELRMATQGMSQKLTSLQHKEPEDMVRQFEFNELQQNVQALQSKLQTLETEDPNSRLYTKASKLVASGASIEEIMQECDLPRAEAELVMSLHTAK